ncbi:hypothetical protein BV25DRAFT_1819797 [Artomyces pyxidatus]|uniref:Uncharacterized protein n=1 Tax=Artomyces pyxidatus TaxID=48021 RepID=A0ACB8TG92_9AGAM|nr:hypothetical protein BV25DRAFT_1819797 [Artomyces pyxidatus]
MASADIPPKVQQRCRIAEIVQYSCENTEAGQLHCFPIPRIFRMCPGRPAVEITRFVNIDLETGAVEIPPADQALPKAKVWRDVVTFPPEEEKSTPNGRPD